MTTWTAPRTWVTGEVVTAAELNTHIRDNELALAPNGTTFTAYTPTLTTFDVGGGTLNPTLGTGSSVAGFYLQYGKMVHCQGQIAFGSSGTNAGTGGYLISLPVTARSGLFLLGLGNGYDGSSDYQDFQAENYDNDHFQCRYNGANLIFTQSLPASYWGANSRIMWNLMYQAA